MASSQSNSGLQDTLQSLADEAVALQVAPGLGMIVFDRRGVTAEVYSGVTKAGDASTNANPNSIWWMASFSKSCVAIITLSLCHQHSISLDDHEAFAKVVPEFELGKGSMARILTGWDNSSGTRKPVSKPATTPTTLRHLLTHTSGIGYEMTDPLIAQAFFPEGPDALALIAMGETTAFNIPPVIEPGTKWLYGMSVDWLAQFATRLSGQTLRQLIQERIVTPLGLEKDTFDSFITPAMDPLLAAIHIHPAPEVFIPTPIRLYQAEDAPAPGFAPVGSGCVYATLASFTAYLQTFLDPQKASKLLPIEVWTEAAQDDLAKRGLSLPDPFYETCTPSIAHSWGTYSRAKDGKAMQVGWSLLNMAIDRVESSTGRSAGTFSWCCLANGHCFMDPVKGLGAILISQSFPFADPGILALRDEMEKAIYQSL